jgi:alpha-glucosidase
VIRPVTRWGKNIQDKPAFAKLLMKLLLCLRGTPFIYQGEELGLTEASIPFERIQDPWGKALWPEWQGRDGCRTPMPWHTEKPRVGFTKSQHAWLPIPEEHIQNAVNIQEDDQNSVLQEARKFIKWRKKQPALQMGDIEFIKTDSDKLLVFSRKHDDQNITCVFNLSEEEIQWNGEDLKPLAARFIS